MKLSISPCAVCNFSVMTEIMYLPTKRAFLVRLSDDADPENGLYEGRVEHLQSGETIRIQSEENLRKFLTGVLLEQLKLEESERKMESKRNI
jgi:hypothetical protein